MPETPHILTPWFFADKQLCQILGLRDIDRAVCRVNCDKLEVLHGSTQDNNTCTYGTYLLDTETLTIQKGPFIEFDHQPTVPRIQALTHIAQELFDRIDPRSDTIEIPTPAGTLVAEYFGNPGTFEGIAVDIKKSDGTKTQVCIAEYDGENDEVHTLAWNGNDETACAKIRVDLNGDYVY